MQSQRREKMAKRRMRLGENGETMDKSSDTGGAGR